MNQGAVAGSSQPVHMPPIGLSNEQFALLLQNQNPAVNRFQQAQDNQSSQRGPQTTSKKRDTAVEAVLTSLARAWITDQKFWGEGHCSNIVQVLNNLDQRLTGVERKLNLPMHPARVTDKIKEKDYKYDKVSSPFAPIYNPDLPVPSTSQPAKQPAPAPQPSTSAPKAKEVKDSKVFNVVTYGSYNAKGQDINTAHVIDPEGDYLRSNELPKLPTSLKEILDIRSLKKFIVNFTSSAFAGNNSPDGRFIPMVVRKSSTAYVAVNGDGDGLTILNEGKLRPEIVRIAQSRDVANFEKGYVYCITCETVKLGRCKPSGEPANEKEEATSAFD